MGKIIVVAGNMDQFRYWIKRNVIPVVSLEHARKLVGLEVDKIYFEGDHIPWFSHEADAYLRHIKERR